MRVVTPAEAAAVVGDGHCVLLGGSGGGHAVAERVITALEQRFLGGDGPRDLTVLFPVGIGDEKSQGAGRLAHDGLVKRIITSTLTDSPPLATMALENRVECYMFPLGSLSQLMREMAAGRPGLITRTGLDTFIDPRHDSGRQNPSATEQYVELLTIDGEEWLRYLPHHVDVAFLRGTTADEDGNITMEHEAVFADMLAMAQATRRCGGTVIVQVSRIARRGTLPPKAVRIPGMLVDLVVVDPDQWQTYATEYSPGYAGELRVPTDAIAPPEFGVRKVIARRAALELFPGAICNLGFGVSNGIAGVGAEEGVLDSVVLTNEQGIIGGAPASGVDAGAGVNYGAMIDMASQFDFYDGGGLDLAFLSFAEADASGSVNVSRFGGRLGGVGGFVNISHGARKVVFSGTFTSGGLDVALEDGRLRIVTEGRHRKFVEQVEQLCFSGPRARLRDQEVRFVTERAVFTLDDGGLTLTEIAPGIDVDRDVLALMGFTPRVAEPLQTMNPALFRPELMGLSQMMGAHPGDRP